jgi:hypothetical protein
MEVKNRELKFYSESGCGDKDWTSGNTHISGFCLIRQLQGPSYASYFSFFSPIGDIFLVT